MIEIMIKIQDKGIACKPDQYNDKKWILNKINYKSIYVLIIIKIIVNFKFKTVISKPQQKQTSKHLAVEQLVHWWSYQSMMKTILWNCVHMLGGKFWQIWSHAFTQLPTVSLKTLTGESLIKFDESSILESLTSKPLTNWVRFSFAPVKINCGIITSIHLVVRVEKWQAWHLSQLPSCQFHISVLELAIFGNRPFRVFHLASVLQHYSSVAINSNWYNLW